MDRSVAPALSVVMPAYNSASWIGSSVARVEAFLDQRGIAGEIIVVDDGSQDGTPDAVPVSARVHVVRQAVNQGKGAALRAGMATATGRVRAFTDADLPYGTSGFDQLLHYIEDRRFHAVFGDRTLPGSSYAHAGHVRETISGMAGIAFRTLVVAGFTDTQCGFKAFRGDIADALFPMTRIDRFAIDVELIYVLLKYRLDIKRIPVRLERNAPSSVRVTKDGLQAVRDIARIRVNWARGQYRSDYLASCLTEELAQDLAGWAAEKG